MYAGMPALEADLFIIMKMAGLEVVDVYLPEGGCNNIAYASIKKKGGGDANQALALMLCGSRQWMPKIAYVFDEDVDIFSDERVKWATAWRLNPEKNIMVLHNQNMLPLDPSLETNCPPNEISKVGFDCTIPIVGKVDRYSYLAATVSDPIPQPDLVESKLEDDLAAEMKAFLQEQPRTRRRILAHFAGQLYPVLYRAFTQLTPPPWPHEGPEAVLPLRVVAES